MISNDANIRIDTLSLRAPATFTDYIQECIKTIQKYRSDEKVVMMNAPFELSATEKPRVGVLLIHGLLDCPFTMRELAQRYQAEGYLSRAILLPGHGTTPSDLSQVDYQDWIDAVQYGITSFKDQVDQLFLVGYSTGGTLSLFHALKNKAISGLILVAPAVDIKAPVELVVGFHRLIRLFSSGKQEWLYQEKEIDDTKYRSVTFNAVTQVNNTIKATQALHPEQLKTPCYFICSEEDETISSHAAIHLFNQLENTKNHLLLYSSQPNTRHHNPNITMRTGHYPNLSINAFSHVSLLFSSHNPHYGDHGDYARSTRPQDSNFIYGAYNRIEERIYQTLYHLKLLQRRRRELTFNPDFDFMARETIRFIKTIVTK